MPQFPEKESSLLSKLKKTKPQVEELENQVAEKKQRPVAVMRDLSQPGTTTGKIIDLDDTLTSNGSTNNSAMMDIFGAANGSSAGGDNRQEVLKLLLKPNGILFEDSVIQIGSKLETRSNLARLGMFYGNKTSAAFDSFNVVVNCPPQLTNQLVVQAKPVDPSIEGGAQVQQLINFVCLQEFNEQPIIQVSFNYTLV